MRACLIACLALLPVLCQAETVWKFTDRSGNVVFSDTPVEGAEPIKIQRPLVVPAVPVPKPEPRAAKEVTTYSRLEITSPSHDTVFNNDPSPIVVTGTSEPTPYSGHLYRLVLDGMPVDAPKGLPQFTLPPQERGTHTLVLEIVDFNLNPVARSAPIQFHVRKQSILYRKSN
jgi:hypothetical protein